MIAILGGFAAVVIYISFDKEDSVAVVQELPWMRYVNLPKESAAQPTDFTVAAEIAVHAVVHVKTKAFRESSGNPFYASSR